MAPNLPVAKVFLMYQEPGKEEYTELQMTKIPKGWYVGKIPKKAVTGKSVQYYFEGRNAAGKPVVGNGELESPNFLLLMEEEAYREVEEDDGDENLGEDVENPLDEAEGPDRQSTLGAHRRGRAAWTSGTESASGGSASASAAASATPRATASRP